jgi:hypothetical protein
MRPQAGVGKLKHAPPMRANDLPVVAQAVSPVLLLSADGAEDADIGDALTAVAARLRADCAALSLYNPSDECDQAAQKEQDD